MNSGEIRSITGLRAIAALGVYVNHFGNPSWFPNRLSNIQSNGGFGVPFFFVLSGFVLTLAYEGKKLDAHNFYVNRFARIGPTYYLALLIASTYISITDFNLDHVFVSHLLGLQAWLPTSDSGFAFNGPGWTISVEIFFYALFPILFSIFGRSHTLLGRWQVVVSLGITMSIFPFLIHMYILGEMRGLENSYIWPYFLPIHYLGLFILGIGGFKARNSIQALLPSKFLQALLCDVIVTASTLLFFVINFKNPAHPLLANAAQFWLLGIPAALSITVLSVAPFSPLSRLLGSKLFWFAGKISMVFYLLHVPITWWVRRLFPMATYEVRFLSVLVATVLVHFLIELPANRLIKKFTIDLPSRLESFKK